MTRALVKYGNQSSTTENVSSRHVGKWFPTGGNCIPPGTTRGRGVPGIWWTEPRDAAKHPTVRRTGSSPKNHPAPNANRPRNAGLGGKTR